MTKLQKLGYKNYKAYLRSEHWKNIKLLFQKTHPKQCFICNSKFRVDLHHISYANIGNENIIDANLELKLNLTSDVVWLCRHHHKKIHKYGRVRLPAPDAHILMKLEYQQDKLKKTSSRKKLSNRKKKTS